MSQFSRLWMKRDQQPHDFPTTTDYTLKLLANVNTQVHLSGACGTNKEGS